MPVVEPEPRGRHQHRPVGGVLCEGRVGQEGKWEEVEEGEFHCGSVCIFEGDYRKRNFRQGVFEDMKTSLL